MTKASIDADQASTSALNALASRGTSSIEFSRSSERGSLPLPGSALCGGTYLGVFTSVDGEPYALILLRKRPANRLTWAEAHAWALSRGASLPRKPEGLAIWAVLQRELPFDCYWLADTVPDYDIAAWAQEWNNGSQALYPRSATCSALAVQRIPLTSLSALPELRQAEADAA